MNVTYYTKTLNILYDLVFLFFFKCSTGSLMHSPKIVDKHWQNAAGKTCAGDSTVCEWVTEILNRAMQVSLGERESE
jgi:hypothetical protein